MTLNEYKEVICTLFTSCLMILFLLGVGGVMIMIIIDEWKNRNKHPW